MNAASKTGSTKPKHKMSVGMILPLVKKNTGAQYNDCDPWEQEIMT